MAFHQSAPDICPSSRDTRPTHVEIVPSRLWCIWVLSGVNVCNWNLSSPLVVQILRFVAFVQVLLNTIDWCIEKLGRRLKLPLNYGFAMPAIGRGGRLKRIRVQPKKKAGQQNIATDTDRESTVLSVLTDCTEIYVKFYRFTYVCFIAITVGHSFDCCLKHK